MGRACGRPLAARLRCAVSRLQRPRNAEEAPRGARRLGDRTAGGLVRRARPGGGLERHHGQPAADRERPCDDEQQDGHVDDAATGVRARLRGGQRDRLGVERAPGGAGKAGRSSGSAAASPRASCVTVPAESNGAAEAPGAATRPATSRARARRTASCEATSLLLENRRWTREEAPRGVRGASGRVLVGRARGVRAGLHPGDGEAAAERQRAGEDQQGDREVDADVVAVAGRDRLLLGLRQRRRVLGPRRRARRGALVVVPPVVPPPAADSPRASRTTTTLSGFWTVSRTCPAAAGCWVVVPVPTVEIGRRTPRAPRCRGPRARRAPAGGGSCGGSSCVASSLLLGELSGSDANGEAAARRADTPAAHVSPRAPAPPSLHPVPPRRRNHEAPYRRAHRRARRVPGGRVRRPAGVRDRALGAAPARPSATAGRGVPPARPGHRRRGPRPAGVHPPLLPPSRARGFTVSTGDDFDWADAGVGALAGTALAAFAIAGAVGLRRRPPTPLAG